MIIDYLRDKTAICYRHIKADEALKLLKGAMQPNSLQTSEHNPTLYGAVP